MRAGRVALIHVMITLFTRPLCAMCAVMGHWLRGLGLAYRELDISAVPGARQQLRALTRGGLSVPTIVLEDGRVLVEPPRQALLAALSRRSH